MKTLYFKLTLCFFLLLAGNATQGIWAQQEPIQIAGIVLDEHGDPLPGANISVKGKEKTGKQNNDRCTYGRGCAYCDICPE